MAPTVSVSQLDSLSCCSSDSKGASEHINGIEHAYWVFETIEQQVKFWIFCNVQN